MDNDGLKVLQAAREFRDRVLRLISKLPKRAAPSLKSQLAKAVRSVSSNIAEGCGRKTTAERSHFFGIANASVAEAQEGLRECINTDLITREEFYREWNRSVVISKMLASLSTHEEKDQDDAEDSETELPTPSATPRA